jgi:hypothetical protein
MTAFRWTMHNSLPPIRPWRNDESGHHPHRHNHGRSHGLHCHHPRHCRCRRHGVTLTGVKSDTPANSAFSIGNRNNQSLHFLHASSTPSGMALIKSLFNEGAVFLAALNMGTGNPGRDEKSHEEGCRRV